MKISTYEKVTISAVFGAIMLIVAGLAVCLSLFHCTPQPPSYRSPVNSAPPALHYKTKVTTPAPSTGYSTKPSQLTTYIAGGGLTGFGPWVSTTNSPQFTTGPVDSGLVGFKFLDVTTAPVEQLRLNSNRTVQIIYGDEALVTFDLVTRRMTFGKNYDPNLAARVFWEAIESAAPHVTSCQKCAGRRP